MGVVFPTSESDVIFKVMKYRQYTPNGPMVSEIGVGAWQLGAEAGWRNMSEKEAIHLVGAAWDAGVNFFDTAPNYGYGTSETRLGKALKNKDRSKLVINTKFGHTVEGPIDFSTKAIRTSVEGSLRRLQTDYLDSAIFHNPPPEYLDGNKADAHYELLERLVDEGKIRTYGASLDTSDEMNLFMETTQGTVIEAFFNMLHQNTARAFDRAKEKSMGIIVKVPLDSGWLTGKYHADSAFAGVRSRWSRSDIQTRAALVQKIKQLLGNEFSLPQAALAFCLSYDAVTTVIPGTSSIAQLESNLAALQKPMPAELVERIETFYRREVEPLKLPW